MRVCIVLSLVLAAAVGPARASGLLVPEGSRVSALALVAHKVVVDITDQVAITTVEQTFRNHTDRPLEATYIFPVPVGASVNKFSMWIDGRETSGELLDAGKASQIYADIVRRTRDPGLLEYMGNGMLRMRVFPVPARGDQKVKLSYTAIAPRDAGVVEYTYPLRTDGRATRSLDEFAVKLNIRSREPIQSVYSPTHGVTVTRKSDREVAVEFDRYQSAVDRDFQLFYSAAGHEIGLTPLLYKPVSGDDGYFMMLLSPQVEAAKAHRVPRDLVMVLDTSGSMSEIKLAQAKKALKFVLTKMTPDERFGLIRFATTVETYKDDLLPATAENLERAEKWVDDLRTTGGTAILPALHAALGLRPKAGGRAFTVAFFTDGMPTVDETNPDRIVKAIAGRNTTETRIFTFGVGDDVNAAMLDQLADVTRAVSTYVRPAEDIEAKVSSLHAKISHPVMTDVKVTATGVRLFDVYPPRLPDLFHGGQLVVIGKYAGQGPATIRLSGRVGMSEKEFVYEIEFPRRTDDGKAFVEHLWARRKVGYLLDQIRVNGQSAELVEEVTRIAKRYGIATPYTSYLVLPDTPMPVAEMGRSRFGAIPAPPSGPALVAAPGGVGGGGLAAPPMKVEEAAKAQAAAADSKKDGIAGGRGAVQEKQIADELKRLPAGERGEALAKSLKEADERNKYYLEAERNWKGGAVRANQGGKLGVDLAVQNEQLRAQDRVGRTASRAANGRQCVEVGGVWIDDKFDAKMKTVVVKSQGAAYFRILARKPAMKDVFALGNHVVWIAPNGTALVIDENDGSDELAEAEIEKLFAKK